MEVYPLNLKSVVYLIAAMFSRILPALALICLSCPISNFAAGPPVAPSAGGEGIQAALDALPAGGEVILSSGKYLIREPVILRRDHQTLRGCGASTVLYLADGGQLSSGRAGFAFRQGQAHQRCSAGRPAD
jgi:hypothetical protein